MSELIVGLIGFILGIPAGAVIMILLNDVPEPGDPGQFDAWPKSDLEGWDK